MNELLFIADAFRQRYCLSYLNFASYKRAQILTDQFHVLMTTDSTKAGCADASLVKLNLAVGSKWNQHNQVAARKSS